MPIEVLVSIYEKFLGKMIRLTASHQAKVEEKPEVRKAGGVYYTPQYIVDYIVENTVGEKLKGRKPDDFEQKIGGIHKKGNGVPFKAGLPNALLISKRIQLNCVIAIFFRSE